VADHEGDKDRAGDRHDDLLSDHGVPEGHQMIAGHRASRLRVTFKVGRWDSVPVRHRERKIASGPIIPIRMATTTNV
jgi:hypothetical protein